MVWGGFMFTYKVFQQAAFACILFIVGQYYITEHISIGSTMAYLLYMQKIVDNFGEMSNQLQSIARVQGSSYKIAELIIKPPKVVMKENGIRTIETEGVVKIEDAKFHYPSKKDV